MVENKASFAYRPLNDHTWAIDVTGEVTSEAQQQLTEVYDQATSAGVKHILLNFSDLDYMNSSGIGLLVTLLIRVQRQGQQLLAYGLNDHYRRIFELTRLDQAIRIFENETGAIQAATSQPEG